MDALSEILKSIKAHRAHAGIMRLTEPWGLATQFGSMVMYGHAEGKPCWIGLLGRGEAVRLEQGDIILVNGPHSLQSSPDQPMDDLVDILLRRGLSSNPTFTLDEEPESPQHLAWGGGGAETRILGVVFAREGVVNPLLNALPPYIVLRAAHKQFPWMTGTVEFLSSAQADSPGYTATMRLLTELALVSIVRSYLLHDTQVTRGWLRGLTDPGIGRALQAMHQRPGHHWTVRELAQLAGHSRTTFANRFAELVEATPIGYLTQWRMHLAAEKLRTSKPNLARLALDLGYASDTAFRNAFRRHHGMVPSQFREGTVPAPEPQPEPNS